MYLYGAMSRITPYTNLHDQLIRQHFLAYFSTDRQALVLALRRDDGLKNKPKRVA